MRFLRTDSIHRWTEGDYTVTTDPAVVDTDMVYAFLVEEAYWWHGRPREVVEHAIASSRPYSMFHDPTGNAGRLRARRHRRLLVRLDRRRDGGARASRRAGQVPHALRDGRSRAGAAGDARDSRRARSLRAVRLHARAASRVVDGARPSRTGVADSLRRAVPRRRRGTSVWGSRTPALPTGRARSPRPRTGTSAPPPRTETRGVSPATVRRRGDRCLRFTRRAQVHDGTSLSHPAVTLVV